MHRLAMILCIAHGPRRVTERAESSLSVPELGFVLRSQRAMYMEHVYISAVPFHPS